MYHILNGFNSFFKRNALSNTSAQSYLISIFEFASYGCASGNGKGQIFVRGQVVETVPEDQVVETLLKHAEAMAAEMAEELGEEALAGTSPMVSAAG